MSSKFVSISRKEMEDFLLPRGFTLIKLENTYELVYAKRVHKDNLKLSLRVYTGILENGISRGIGEDAIRVLLFMKRADDSIVKLSSYKRVNRIESWQENLQKRIDSWINDFPDKKCKSCKMPMILRKGKNGSFYGCSNFPSCRCLENFKNETKS